MNDNLNYNKIWNFCSHSVDECQNASYYIYIIIYYIYSSSILARISGSGGCVFSLHQIKILYLKYTEKPPFHKEKMVIKK